MRIKLEAAAFLATLALGSACGGDVTVVDDGSEGGDANPSGPNTVGSSSDGAAAPNGSGPNGSGPNGSGAGSSQGGSSSGAGGGYEICADFGTACSSCVAEACPSDWCACVATDDCPQLFGCTNGCDGDPACNQQCLENHQAGISAAYLVSSCAGGPCSGSCPQGGEELEPCGTCLFQSCDEEMNACLVEPTCMPVLDCATANCQPVCGDD